VTITLDLFTAYQNLLEDGLGRARKSVGKIRKGTYKADDYVSDIATTNLQALELAMKPYQYVLQQVDDVCEQYPPATTTTQSKYIMAVAGVAGAAPSASGTLTDASGTKTLVVTAEGTPNRDGLIVVVPPLSGSGAATNDIYKGKIDFTGGGATTTIKVILHVT
jgi:hypothetical protein